MDSNNEKEISKCDSCPKKSNCGGCSSSSCNGGCNTGRGKLHCYDWLSDIPDGFNTFEMVEVQFKNTRKAYYKNSTNIDLSIGDMVAVEANPGHDIGEVTLIGKLVAIQMKKANLRPDVEILRVFRKVKATDLEKYEEAKSRENDTMIKSRKIANDLHLNMKIGDVEYQGDCNKAIFYYIADERVDFRQLIRILAETFKVRIEMKQIGARQEAGRIGGIGPCGRPLCCSNWMTNFVSVSTNAARFQDISLNPQKLAGQCAKLKCCLNFEVDAYVEASKRMPPREARLETRDCMYFHFKSDIFKREITYSTDKSFPANLVTIDVDRVFEIISLNRRGVRPERLLPDGKEEKVEKKEFGDIIGQDSVTRFDKSGGAGKRKPRNNNNRQDNNGNSNGEPRPERNNNRPPRGERPQQPRNNNNGGAGAEGSNAAQQRAPQRNGQQPKKPQQEGQEQNNSRNPNNNDRRPNNNRGNFNRNKNDQNNRQPRDEAKRPTKETDTQS